MVIIVWMKICNTSLVLSRLSSKCRQANVDMPGKGEGGPKNPQIYADILYG